MCEGNKLEPESSNRSISRKPEEGIQTSSIIPYIRTSLKYQIDNFKHLETEMISFKGPNDEEKISIRTEIQVRLSELNPHHSQVVLDAHVDSMYEASISVHNLYANRFSTPFMNCAIPITFLSVALAEALINSMVATGLTLTEKIDLFPFFDRMDIYEKWRIGPKLIQPNSRIDPGNHLFGILKKLVQLRNAFTHSKADISLPDGSILMKGTSHRRLRIDSEGIKELLSFGELPDKLFDMVLKDTPEVSFRIKLENVGFRFEL